MRFKNLTYNNIVIINNTCILPTSKNMSTIDDNINNLLCYLRLFKCTRSYFVDLCSRTVKYNIQIISKFEFLNFYIHFHIQIIM